MLCLLKIYLFYPDILSVRIITLFTLLENKVLTLKLFQNIVSVLTNCVEVKMLTDSLGYLIGTCNRLMKREMDLQLEEYSLTTSQWAMIKLLSEKGPLSQKEIADELHGDKATAGEVVKRLEAATYITRSASEKDKRAYIVTLTSKALALIDDSVKKSALVNEKALCNLSSDEITNFYKTLNQIILNMEE